MRAVIQRVKKADVKVDGKTIGEIDRGLLVLLGVGPGDTTKNADELLKKVVIYEYLGMKTKKWIYQ